MKFSAVHHCVGEEWREGVPRIVTLSVSFLRYEKANFWKIVGNLICSIIDRQCWQGTPCRISFKRLNSPKAKEFDERR
jgi:hypothetical protein